MEVEFDPAETAREVQSTLDLLLPPSSGGRGFHGSFWEALLKLRNLVPEERAVELIVERGASLGAPVSRLGGEIRRSARIAYSSTGGGSTDPLRRIFDVEPDLTLIENILHSQPQLTGLEAISPRPAPMNITTAEALEYLFPNPDTLLIVGRKSSAEAAIVRRSASGLETCQQIVPNPARSACGYTKKREVNVRCDANILRRDWLVIECDFAPVTDSGVPTIFAPLFAEFPSHKPRDMGAAVIAYLRTIAPVPLRLAVYSGGKSIHGWFPATGRDPVILANFFAQAKLAGACNSTWTVSQYVRVPGGTAYKANGQFRQPIVNADF
jgi:hypothetical protein